MRRGVVTWLMLCVSQALFCQKAKVNELPLVLLDYIQEAVTGGESFNEEYAAELVEFFCDALENPLNINDLQKKDLKKFFFISEFQAELIMEYRRDYGDFVSINELFNIPGISREQAELLSIFLTVSNVPGKSALSASSLIKDSRIQLLGRVKIVPEKQRGYTPVTKKEFEKSPDCRYLGPPGQLYSQIKYECSDFLRLCITAEKDPGEKGIDYLSGSLSIQTKGFLEKLVAGSYSARFGQGLVLWSSSFATLNSLPSSACRNESAFMPYNSTGENNSFTGAAVSLRAGRFEISAMASQRAYDARVVEEGYTSLLTTGLHNTTTTLSRRRTLQGSAIGLNICLKGEKLRISQTTLIYRYDIRYAGRDSVRKVKDRFPAGWGANAGISFYRVISGNRIFGELAIDHGFSTAFLAGIISAFGSRSEGSLVLRSFSASYLAPYSEAASYGSFPKEDKGVKIAFSYLAGKYSKASFYADFMQDYSKVHLQFDYKPQRGFSHSVLLNRGKTAMGIRYSTSVELISAFSLQSRLECKFTSDGKNEIGTMIFGELIYKPLSKVIRASLRVSYFDVPDWDVRIYAYERDLLHTFSIPVCYGRALKMYLNVHIPIHRSTDMWFKAAQIKYLDRETIGESNELIEGSVKSELKIQLRFRF